MTLPPTSSPPPRLYHFRISHYNEKVRWALDFKGWPHVRTALVPGFHLPTVWRLTGQRLTPVLDLDGRSLTDSTAIIAELERLRPEPPLYPADPAERQRALAIEDHFDERVAPDLRRLFWSTYLPHADLCARMITDGSGPRTRAAWRALMPVWRPLFRSAMGIDPRRVARARDRLAGHFDRLEAELDSRDNMVGDRFSVADLSAAAIMSAIIRPPQFPYPLVEPWPEEFTELRAAFAHRRGFQWVLDVYERHRGVSCEIGAAPVPTPVLP